MCCEEEKMEKLQNGKNRYTVSDCLLEICAKLKIP
jgi:hypothetical protein